MPIGGYYLVGALGLLLALSAVLRYLRRRKYLFPAATKNIGRSVQSVNRPNVRLDYRVDDTKADIQTRFQKILTEYCRQQP